MPKYSSGPNLNHLFIGSEGVFGIITRATIRVFRLPEAQVFATVAFDSFDQGFDAAAELMALGLHPTLLDLTEEEAENEEGNEIKLFLLFEGYREGVAAQEQRAMQVCAQFGGRDIGPGPTLNYWEARHESGERYKLNALGRPREERWTRQWGRSFDYLHDGAAHFPGAGVPPPLRQNPVRSGCSRHWNTPSGAARSFSP